MFNMDSFDEMSTPETASSGVSTTSNKSDNPFFAGITYPHRPRGDFFDADDPLTPTTMQKNLCLNATSDMDVCLTDDEIETPPSNEQKKICVCAVSKPAESQESGQPSQKLPSTASFPVKTTPITDEYKITHEILGIGESGKVMACFSKADNTKYALKVLRDGPKSRREVELHYLTNQHENIVSIIDIFENTFDSVKCLLVVVEFLEGGDLLTLFENRGSRPYSERQVAEIIRQIGSAVLYLQGMNIAHRDIKLENILCSSVDDEECTYKLADFGFAKRPERNHLMESPCCTPYYVAPEVLGHERYDKSCDMWSIGVVMYILLCGYPPFYSMKGLPLSPGMKDRITTGLYAFPPADWDHISDWTKNEIRHLLKTDPATRTSIQQLLAGPFVQLSLKPEGNKGSAPMFIDSPDSAFDSADSVPATPESPDTVVELSKSLPAKPSRLLDAHAVSARQFSRTQTARPPRLHSIQEEVGRALNMMRLGGDSCFIKSLKTSGNSLLERRRSLAAQQPKKSVVAP